ncbi:RING-H2 finger protein ATL17-like [Andrographis paniculata]|uniref:RING-H2 finger protein ATL17-like n=1 Tax=Andrographis paniculata TaxID=175694 RepID=UPI0021E95F59|nr:RING-H2 finger protein ATL17-like [Andrographis paniculata]
MERIFALPSQSSHTTFGHALLLSLLGTVIISLATMLYHVLLIKCCVWRQSSTTTENESAADGAHFTGVDEKVLQTIPIYAFSAVKCYIDQDECVVCLGELEDEDTVRWLPNCKHAFHVTCIDRWFAAQTSCPMCRSPVVSKEETHSEPPFVFDAHLAADSGREISEPSTSTTNNLESSALRHFVVSLSSAPSPPRLKRSLSMDQSLMRSNLQRNPSSSWRRSRTLRRSGSYTFPRSSHFDPGSLSYKWLRSFSRLGLGNGNSNGPILPY